MKINHLTPSEEILMNILWKLNSAYMRDVVEHYPEPKPHQNTISTFIKILVEKAFLTTEKEGRIFKYTVAVPYDVYRKFLLVNFLKNYFDDSASEMMKVLLEENLLQFSDLNQFFEIKTILNPIIDHEEKENHISDFIEEITSKKKSKKKKEKKKDKKKK
jgi:predicted transcriptional regulator